MAAPPGREIRAGAASWPGASGLPFGFRVSSSPGGWNWAAFPRGNPAAWLPTFALPIAYTGAGGEIEAGGGGTAFQMQRGTRGWIYCAAAWICGRVSKIGWALGPCPASLALPCAGLGEGRTHPLPGPLSIDAQMARTHSHLLPSGQTVTWDGDFRGAQ